MKILNRSVAALSVLAAMSVAGQAHAEQAQARPRSAPPTTQAPPPSQGGQSGQSGGDRGAQARPRSAPQGEAARPPQQESRPQGQPSERSRPQVESRREAPPPQARPDARDDRRDDSRPGNRGNDNRPNDNRGASGSDNSRQAVPAPRDRYIDLNRDGRNDNRDSRVLGPQDRRDLERRNNNWYDGRYDRYDSRYSNYSYNYSGPKVIFAPRRPQRFSRPWFSFRPLIRLPFGITLGYSHAFPSWYDPYIVGRPGYVRPYMPYGGVTFDIEPRDAELWIDGDYVGRVSDYSYYDPPLTLVAGRHYVEIRDRYSRPLAFEITVISGQVIPYQGTLPYYR
jgi:hypothetical protein